MNEKIINPLLTEIYTTKHLEDEQGNSINIFPAATPRIVAEYLYDAVKNYNCTQTLEIGMGFGLSTIAICQAHGDKGYGNHIAIDPFQNGKTFRSLGLKNIQKAGLTEKLRFLELSSVVALPKLIAEDQKINLAFLDGNHQFDYTLIEFFYSDMLLEKGGLIIFDDLWMPSVRKVISFVLKNRNYKLLPIKAKSPWIRRFGRTIQRITQTSLSWENGLKWSKENICIIQKQGDDKRQWDFYRDF